MKSTLVQDDTGVPHKSFDEKVWQLAYHGVYDGPINLFKYRYQGQFEKQMKEKSTGPLPFVYGYGMGTLKGSNLLSALKSESKSKCVQLSAISK